MRDEVKRILKLVQEGKISADDAAELIEAFETPDEEQVEAGVGASTQSGSANTGSTEAKSNGYHGSTAGKDPFRAFVETMEKFSREAVQSVDWTEVSKQVRTSAQQGMETLKAGLDAVSKGKGFVFFGSSETREVTLPLSVPSDKALRIENFCGSIKVVGGFDLGSVTAHAHFRGATNEETRRRAAEYTLVVEESDGHVLIRQPDIPNVAVDIEVQLSSSNPLEIRSESGDITVLDTHNGVRIAARSGDVKLRGLDGVVDVNLTSGDIGLEDITSSQVTIENKSGDLQLRRVKGNVSARTTSGDVRLTGYEGKTLSVETVSGDVSLETTTAVSGVYNLRTVSGDSHVILPDGNDCRVSLSSLRGGIACDLALQDEARNDQRLTGRLGDGNGSLDVSAVTGDIELRMARVAVTD